MLTHFEEGREQSLPDNFIARVFSLGGKQRKSQSNDAFRAFEENISRETVTDDDIDAAFENVVALDVADEIQQRPRCDEKLPRLMDQFISLGIFFAV